MNNSRIYPMIIGILGLITIGCIPRYEPVENPDPLRFQQEIEQFQHWDQQNEVPGNCILFIGSSSIRMWDTDRGFPEYPVINRGFGGAHISDILYYYEQVVAPYDPELIVFYTGDNDVAAGKSEMQVMGDYQALISRIRRDKPDALFLYIPIKPSGSRWQYWETMAHVNDRVLDHSRKDPSLYYIDLAIPLLDEKGQPDNRFFLDDQLHLNREGYDLWESIIRPELRRLYDR